MLKRAKAFSPAGVSSFFEICDRTPDGKMIADPERIGARGGGFALNKGVSTEVIVEDAEEKQVQVFINGELCPEAETTKYVVETLTAKVSEKYDVKVNHFVEVPIGAGFGSSAAGALGAALALSKALGLNFTYNQLGRVAHVAEVRCRTGLGTVGPLLFGGCGLTLEPGAPGHARLDRIPVSPNHRIIAGTFRPYPTKEMLTSQEKRETINEWGQKTLQKILANPSLENFMGACKQFAVETGFATERVQNLIELAEKAGAVGAAQNMLGEAVHALVTVDKIESVHTAFKKVLHEENIIITNIDIQGARIG
ncbi:MAG TPA: pantothenate kinase [Candidatus Bathyarchaeota archaeon]|nr:pantothenate kinase [Candidatus Bathyarchaeota archaeon]